MLVNGVRFQTEHYPSMSDPKEQLALLSRLARGPVNCGGHEKTIARQFVTAGLARKIPDGALRGHHEITPRGRTYIVASAASRRRDRKASTDGRRKAGFATISSYRAAVATVADMQAAGWDVISKCGTCSHSEAVDLDQLAWSRGAATVLWGHHEPCSCAGCRGEMEIFGRPPAGGGYQALTAD